MINPETKKRNPLKCCKGDNLYFNYGDGVEFEVYTCKKCFNDYNVNIEIKRDWGNIELIK